MTTEVHRSELGRVGAGVWGVLAVGLGVDVLRRGQGPAAWLSLIVLAALCLSVYAFAWRPAVLVDDEAVTLVNPARSIRIPWDAVTYVGGTWSLQVRTRAADYRAWASGPRPRRTSPGSDADAGRLSRRLADRWEERSRVGPQQKPGEPVTIAWDRPLLVGVAVLAASSVAMSLVEVAA